MIWGRIDRACPVKLPEGGISVEQLIHVVKKYLSDHPEQLHETPELLLYLALMDSFGDLRYPKFKLRPEASP